MKFLNTVVLALFLLIDSVLASGVTNSYTVGKSLSAAGGFVTSLNRVDGSFEKGNSGWVASVGTIVKTANTEMQGNYVGVWAGTGTGTLDLQWTATASNTYEASAQVNVKGEDDVYICSYVGTIEQGCKLIPALDKIQKVSAIADSILSSAFNLRLKHTGSDAFGVDVDDGKIEPYTLNTANLTEEDAITYSGYNGWDASNRAYFKTLDPLSHYGDTVTATNSTYTKFTILQPCDAKLSVAGSMTNISGITLKHFSASGTEKHSVYTYPSDGRAAIPLITPADIGDYFYVQLTTQPFVDTSLTSFSISCSKKSDNVVQSWQDGTEWKALTYQEVNALSGNQGLGSFTAGGVEWKRDGGDLLYKGKLTAGAVSVAEARLPLPNNLLSADATKIQSLQIGGPVSIGSASGASWYSIIQPTVNYIAFGSQSSTYAGLQTRSGDTLFSSGTTFSFNVRIPIQGWSSTPTLLALPASKENRFEGEYNVAGTLQQPNNTVLGNATVSDTSLYTIPLQTGVFTVAPNVVVSVNDSQLAGNGGRIAGVVSVSTSQIVIRTSVINIDGQNTKSALPFTITVSKKSPDYTAPGVFISNLNPDGFNRTLGTVGLIDNFSFSYGTTNATTVCSASPCSYLDQIGGYVTSVTRAGVGNYTVNFSKTFSKVKCVATAINASTSGEKQAFSTRCENCSSMQFFTEVSQVGTYDTYATLLCQGY